MALETTKHLLSAYSAYEYIHRHNAAFRDSDYHLRQYYELDKILVLPYVSGNKESLVGDR